MASNASGRRNLLRTQFTAGMGFDIVDAVFNYANWQMVNAESGVSYRWLCCTGGSGKVAPSYRAKTRGYSGPPLLAIFCKQFVH